MKPFNSYLSRRVKIIAVATPGVVSSSLLLWVPSKSPPKSSSCVSQVGTQCTYTNKFKREKEIGKKKLWKSIWMCVIGKVSEKLKTYIVEMAMGSHGFRKALTDFIFSGNRSRRNNARILGEKEVISCALFQDYIFRLLKSPMDHGISNDGLSLCNRPQGT